MNSVEMMERVHREILERLREMEGILGYEDILKLVETYQQDLIEKEKMLVRYAQMIDELEGEMRELDEHEIIQVKGKIERVDVGDRITKN